MPVKIRLARRGRKKRPYYHVVIADARAPRDGKFIENIGSYNPMTVPATIEIDRDRAYEWLQKGAQPTETVKALLKFKGVYYKKHLMRGVAKGAMTEEKAMELYNQWIEVKESKIEARKEQTRIDRENFWKQVSGEIKPMKVKAAKESGDAFREGGDEAAPAAEDAPAEATPIVEEAKAEEPVAETPKEEAPNTEEKPAVEEAPAKEEKVEEAPKVEEKVEAAEVVAPVAAAEAVVEEAPATSTKPDDLTKIEGIGPAISKLLAAQGIVTFADLGAKKAEDVKAILTNAEGNFGFHDPTTWPKQSDMAAKGEWDALKKWQDELDGGKEVSASAEEE